MTPGASEVAVILGLGRQRQDGEPWVSELELYCRLTGLLVRYTDDGGPDAEAGKCMEPGILKRLADERQWVWGTDIWPGPPLEQPGWTAEGVPWHARPDAMHRHATVEAKAPLRLYPEEWGETEHDIPPYHACQVVAQMAVAHAVHGTDAGILAAHARAGRPGQVWRVYEFRRSARRERKVIALVNRWLDRHVHARVPPQPDGSESASYALRRMFRPENEVEHVASTAELEAFHRLLRSKEKQAELKHERELAEQRLQSAMGEAGILLDENKNRLATWRANKHGVRTFRTYGEAA